MDGINRCECVSEEDAVAAPEENNAKLNDTKCKP